MVAAQAGCGKSRGKKPLGEGLQLALLEVWSTSLQWETQNRYVVASQSCQGKYAHLGVGVKQVQCLPIAMVTIGTTGALPNCRQDIVLIQHIISSKSFYGWLAVKQAFNKVSAKDKSQLRKKKKLVLFQLQTSSISVKKQANKKQVN